MPGPGGGSNGGGFRGGSGSSGGFRGGSPGGHSGGGYRPGGMPGGGFGFNPRPPRHNPGGFGFGPRPRRHGGGCSSILVIPILIIFLLLFLFSAVTGNVTVEGHEAAITSGSKSYTYSEEDFQDFADQEYRKAFGSADRYEGNILLAILTNDEADDYFALAWVGDDIDPEIREMFGGYTELGDAMNRYVNGTYYAYSLDSDLAAVVQEMTTQVSPISSGTPLSSGDAYLVNYTDLDLSAETVDHALEEFREKTGIPMVIVVESLEKVFPVKLAFGSILNSGIMPVVLVILVIAGAVIVKKKKAANDTE